MDKDNLIERLKYVMCKNDVIALAEYFTKTHDGVSILFHLCESEDTKLSFHAAWVLENVLVMNKGLLIQSIPILIEKTPKLTNPSIIRHYCKLLSYTFELNYNNQLPAKTVEFIFEVDLEPLVESSFEWLMDTKTKPAVKAHCIDILYYLSDRFSWIKSELPYIIEFLLLDASPGIRSKGLKTLEVLRAKTVN